MDVVGFVGFKQSGKDTAAEALVNQRGFKRVGFADAVKESALAIDPIVHMWADGYQERLSTLVKSVGWERAKRDPEVRRLLQVLGTEGVRDIVGDDSWLRAWKRRVMDKETGLQYSGEVVPDVRFLNEAEFLRKEYDALLIRIDRPGSDTTDGHGSEQEQLGIEAHMRINNNRGVETLHEGVLSTFDMWKHFGR